MRSFNRTIILVLMLTLFSPVDVDIASETVNAAEIDSLKLPDVSDIASIIADTYHHPFGPLCGPDLVNFQIPREGFADVLQYFQRGKLVKDMRCENDHDCQPDSSEIGTMRINLKEGGCIRICWFDHGKNRLHFSCAGQRYVRVGDWIGQDGSDETLNIDGRIRSLCQKAMAKQVQEKSEDKPQ